MDKIPLNYEASEGDTNKQVTSTLPKEVVQCLENARFVSLLDVRERPPKLTLEIASPRDVHRQRAQRVTHELHVPPVVNLLLQTCHCHDHESVLAQNHQHHHQPKCLPSGSRLYVLLRHASFLHSRANPRHQKKSSSLTKTRGLPPPTNTRPPSLRRLPRPRVPLKPRIPAAKPQLLRHVEHQRHHRRCGAACTDGFGGGEVLL